MCSPAVLSSGVFLCLLCVPYNNPAPKSHGNELGVELVKLLHSFGFYLRLPGSYVL